MRTIIDLDDRQVSVLEKLQRKDKTSRSALIRKAVDLYINGAAVKDWSARPAFGAWHPSPRDGVDLQRKLRSEWSS